VVCDPFDRRRAPGNRQQDRQGTPALSRTEAFGNLVRKPLSGRCPEAKAGVHGKRVLRIPSISPLWAAFLLRAEECFPVERTLSIGISQCGHQAPLVHHGTLSSPLALSSMLHHDSKTQPPPGRATASPSYVCPIAGGRGNAAGGPASPVSMQLRKGTAGYAGSVSPAHPVRESTMHASWDPLPWYEMTLY
jgi:hypothetical protein